MMQIQIAITRKTNHKLKNSWYPITIMVIINVVYDNNGEQKHSRYTKKSLGALASSHQFCMA